MVALKQNSSVKTCKQAGGELVTSVFEIVSGEGQLSTNISIKVLVESLCARWAGYTSCARLVGLPNPPIFSVLFRAEINTKATPNKIITALSTCPLDNPNNNATPFGCLNAGCRSCYPITHQKPAGNNEQIKIGPSVSA